MSLFSIGSRNCAGRISRRTRSASPLLSAWRNLGMSFGDLLADFLRDGIHELRLRRGRVNYRVLYFFHGRDLAVLAHAITKEGEVPDADVDRAVRRRKAFASNPTAHSYAEEDHKS
jgi:Phage derived protein Gp49-like (DUF891)